MSVSPERIEALREDPDFQALVKCLKSQAQDEIDRFLKHYDKSTLGGNEHGREHAPDL
jgi:hypothetical protein